MNVKRILLLVQLILISEITVFAVDNPVRFIENRGQLGQEVLFYADVPGGTVYLHKDKLVFLFVDYGKDIHDHFRSDKIEEAYGTGARLTSDMQDKINGHVYKVIFKNISDNIKITAYDPGTERYNYFIGSDRTRWASGVKSYGEIRYQNIYPDIDFMMYSTFEGMKYDFIVRPGADPADIKMVYKGLDEMAIKNGALYLKTRLGEVVEHIPLAYQADGSDVECRYQLDKSTLSFHLPKQYDVTQKLTIDPLLIFSTYSGSAADNWGNTATFDQYGNLYSGGMTNHTRFFGGTLGTINLGSFNATEGAFQTEYGGIWDVAILKYDSTGSDLLYATYLGGTNSEVPQSLVVNNKGELLILGITSSLDFPVTDQAYDTAYNGGVSGTLFESSVLYSNGSDLFIAKLSENGDQLLAATYLGGTDNDGLIQTFTSSLVRNYGDQSRGDIIVDENDNVYIASRTSSEDFPLVNAFQNEFGGGNNDGVVIKLEQDLSSLIWSSYYGGFGEDAALSIKLTSENEVYIAGGTTSIDLPTTPNTIHPGPTGVSDVDGFVAKIASDGSALLAATYIGTTDYDQVYQMDLDSNGDVYLVGQTRGPYPVTVGPRVDENSGQFVHKLTPDLSETLFSTVFGGKRGEPDIYITAFLVNDCDNLYISGWGSPLLANRTSQYMGVTTSALQITSDAYQPSTDGSSFYLAVYTDDMSELLYATFLGSSSSMVHVDGGTSRFDKRGIVYHAVCASCNPDDSSFPTTPGAWAEKNGSRGCNNAAFKFDLASLNARIRTNTPEFDQPNIVKGCAPFEVAFENISVGGEVYEWFFGDDMDTVSFERDTIYHTYEAAGTYKVVLKAIDSSTCAEVDFDFATIIVYETNFEVSEGTTICGGDFAQLSASGGVSYLWYPVTGLINPNSAFPKAFADTTTTYFVNITDKNGCTFEDSLIVEVIPEIKVNITIENRNKCGDQPVMEFLNNSTNVESVLWEFGNNVSSTELNPTINFSQPGSYVAQVSLFNQQCVKQFSIPFEIQKLFVPNIITPNNDGLNDTFEITSTLPFNLKIMNRYGKELFFSENYLNDWDGAGLNPGIYYYEITFPDFESCTGWIQLMY